MENSNEMKIIFDSRSCNESFVRVSVAAFCTQLNPTLEEVADIKTAVSEAVTNAIIHGYDSQVKKVEISCRIEKRTLYVEVTDRGLRMWPKPWNPFSPPGRSWTGPVWDLPLWRRLWMMCRWNHGRVKEPQSA